MTRLVLYFIKIFHGKVRNRDALDYFNEKSGWPGCWRSWVRNY